MAQNLQFLTHLTFKCASFDIESQSNRQNVVNPQVFCTSSVGHVLLATTACTFSTSQLPKVVRTWGVLPLFTWKCASRHNAVHFFDICTCKSRPTLRCFVHFYFQMCFAPQRRALFQHLNSQKWLGAEVFCTFLLPHVLRDIVKLHWQSLDQ